MSYSYEILPRPDHLGGGWRLRLLEDGLEVGGGVFPVEAVVVGLGVTREESFADAEAEAYEWMDSRPGEA